MASRPRLPARPPLSPAGAASIPASTAARFRRGHVQAALPPSTCPRLPSRSSAANPAHQAAPSAWTAQAPPRTRYKYTPPISAARWPPRGQPFADSNPSARVPPCAQPATRPCRAKTACPRVPAQQKARAARPESHRYTKPPAPARRVILAGALPRGSLILCVIKPLSSTLSRALRSRSAWPAGHWPVEIVNRARQKKTRPTISTGQPLTGGALKHS
jgi:hypothetical protein